MPRILAILSLLAAGLLGVALGRQPAPSQAAAPIPAQTIQQPPAAAPQPTHQIRLNGHTFTLPQGFTIELAAGPDLVPRPIVADFDDQGRLYVADSSGSNEKVEVQLAKRPHRIVRLSAADSAGKFTQATTFADKMMFPEGVMHHAGAIYISAPPSIWKLTDNDGDGVAETRVEWFNGATLTGCANDLHGPYLGPDGWIYWCKGAFAEQKHDIGRADGKPLITKASHIFRRRPDGGPLEPVMTGGMDNPVDVVFTPGGERIFTTTFFQHPAGGRRDGLIHAIYGGVYGKDHSVVYSHKWTAPTLMPVLAHLGPAAPCGLTRYESDAFGPAYRDNLFAAQFNLRKISRHVLTEQGAGFQASSEDFLVSDNFDFHPTDVLADADGSLLVIDTGGWYKLCCPTSQIQKPDVLGAIYRVRRLAATVPMDPRGLALNWPALPPADLCRLLDDPRPAVRSRAIQTLGDRGQAAIESLAATVERGPTPMARSNAIWAATRIDAPAARAVAIRGLADPDAIVRQVAIHSISVRKDRSAVAKLLPLLGGESQHNRRAAAEALGRLGDAAAIAPLLAAAGEATDRSLQHSITYALIELAQPAATAEGLRSANILTRRAALIALDQMDGGDLKVAACLAELSSPDASMRETAWWIAGRRPQWGGDLADRLGKMLEDPALSPAQRDELAQQLGGLAQSAAISRLLGDQLRKGGAAPAACATALSAIARSSTKQPPADWLDSLAMLVLDKDRTLAAKAVSTLRSLPAMKQPHAALSAALVRLWADESAPPALRFAAAAATPQGAAPLSSTDLAFLLSGFDAGRPMAIRSDAADALIRAKLDDGQRIQIAGQLDRLSPMEADRMLEIFARSKEDRVGLAAVAGLGKSAVKLGLRPQAIRTRLAGYGPAVGKAAEKLYEQLDAEAARRNAKLDELLATLTDGDIRRGQAIFNSPRAICSACHAIGYVGGAIGPDLTRIGAIRTERDLLESILYPSASFVRGYEPTRITATDGRLINGFVRNQTAEEITLEIGPGQQTRLPLSDVKEMAPGELSLMPAGLDQQLSRQELADLIAFLKKACR